MAALQCEICGGKLIGKPGGIFECDSCGLEYSTEWAKAKIQEIKGTVKVEGTVEVKGTVKVEGGVNIESLLKRGQMALEDKEWSEATRFFDDALNLNAECAQAYLGKLMAELKVSKQEELEIRNEPFDNKSNYQKAVRFADASLYRTLEGFIAAINERIKKQEEEKYIAIEQNREKLLPIFRRLKPVQNLIAAGVRHTAVVKIDGTAVAVGDNLYGQCNVSDWTDLVAISAGKMHTVGLRADGTVVATEFADKFDRRLYHGQCDVSGWRDIVAVSAGGNHTIGLKADGTVVAAGNNDHCECRVSDWRNIVAISAGKTHTVGLKADGTVVSVGANYYGECKVSDWKEIVAISAGDSHTIGLKADGTVVATKYTGEKKYYYARCEVSGWADIVAISAGDYRTVGLKADGTVVSTRKWDEISTWKDIVAINAGEDHIVGLKTDGTLVTTGKNDYSQCDIVREKLFKSLDTLEQEIAEAKQYQQRQAELKRQHLERKAEEARKRREEQKAALEQEKSELLEEQDNLRGLFTGKRRKEINTHLAQIEAELKRLR